MEKVVNLQKKRNERTFNKLRKAAEDARAEITRDPWPTLDAQKKLIKEQHELLFKIYAVVNPMQIHLESQYPEWPVDIRTESVMMVSEIRKLFDEQI